jgi:hypothetical protein
MLALVAGNSLDGCSGLCRKEPGVATAGRAAAPFASPRAQFTALLDSLVGASEAGNTPAVKKEDAPRGAFWVAVATATAQVEPAGGATQAEDKADPRDSGTVEAAATLGDAAAVMPATPQLGALPLTAIATTSGSTPGLPDRTKLSWVTPPAQDTGGVEAADQGPSGKAATEPQKLGSALWTDADAGSGRMADAPLAEGGTQGRNPAASIQESTGMSSDDLQVPPAPSAVSPIQAAAVLPAAEQPDATKALKAARQLRPRREEPAPAQGPDQKNEATIGESVAGQLLATPTVTGQASAVREPDARTAQSGAVPGTAAAAGQPAADSAPAASELPDDALESSVARPMVVAFTARLRPVEAAPEAPGDELANGVDEPVEASSVPVTAAASGQTTFGEGGNSHDASAASVRQPDAAREPARKPDASTAAAPDSAVTAHPAITPQPPAASEPKPRESAPASPPSAPATEPAAAAEVPKQAAAHDIKVEVAGQGDQRVEVRVSERAGDMRVEVRTPDGGLAGDLRQDLPALASKLEQTGFRAETWHPAAAAERQGTAEAAAGAASQNSERQPGQNGGQRERDGQQQPKPKDQENETPSQETGKDFAWLFSSIQ